MDNHDRLASWLQGEGKTAADLARAGGWSEAIVSMWLSGKRTPNLRNAFALQEITGIKASTWDPPVLPRSAERAAAPRRRRAG